MTVFTEEALETILTGTDPVTVMIEIIPVTVGSKTALGTVLIGIALVIGEITLGQQAEIIIEEMKAEINIHLTHGEILEIIAEEGVQAGIVSSSGDLNLQEPSRTEEITEPGAEIIP